MSHLIPVSALALAVTTIAAAGDVPSIFGPWSNFSSAEKSTGVAVGDFNGDGANDVAVSGRDSNSVFIHLNDGSGNFSATQEVATGEQPRYVKTIDLEGDGDIDLVTPDRNSNTISLLVNDGTGVFTAGEATSVWVPWWVGVADMDVDGSDDLIVISGGERSRIRILLNDGSGTFTESQAILVGDGGRGAAIADANGDNAPDILVTNLVSDTVALLLSNGLGALNPILIQTHDGPRDATSGDFDGDGDIDFAVAYKNSDQVQLFRNNGTGMITSAAADLYQINHGPHAITSADLDLDGDLDLAICEVSAASLSVLYNDGSGLFTHVSVITSGGQADITHGDMDNDGDIDLCMSNVNDDALYVFENRLIIPPCPADLVVDSEVVFTDLVALLAVWGECPAECPADIDEDGFVGFSDLIFMLTTWGRCP